MTRKSKSENTTSAKTLSAIAALLQGNGEEFSGTDHDLILYYQQRIE